MNFYKKTCFIFLFLLLLTGATFASQWSQWRGPFHNGSTDEKSLPESFEKIAWSLEMPGPGSSTPVISDGKVFVSSDSAEGTGLYGICADVKTGEQLWKKKLSETSGRSIKRKGNMAAPSAVADGKRVYFIFDTGDLTALDYDGEILWSRNIAKEYGHISVKFGYGSTPLLYDGKLYVFVQRRPEAYIEPKNTEPYDSFLLAIDPATGKNIFKHKRQVNADGETYDAYSSPIPFEYKGRKEIILAGANSFSGHHPETGKQLWSYYFNPLREKMWRIITSPVTAGDFMILVQPRGNDCIAITGGQSGKLTDANVAWKYSGKTSDSPTPAYYKGRLYLLDGTKTTTITCLDAKTGKLIWESMMPGKEKCYASITAGDDKLYALTEKGEAVIFTDTGKELKMLSMHDFADRPARSSISIAYGRLFVRTANNLYCIEK